MSKSILAFLIVEIAMASSASSQVLFHDDWEQYRAGTQDWQANYGFGPFDINYEAGEVPPTVVEGARDGVAPYSGTKMYDFRASAIKFGRILGHDLNLKSTVNPIVDLSIRFAVPESYNVKTLLYFGLRTSLFNGGKSGSGLAEFDLYNNTFKGFSATAKQFPLSRNEWNEVRIRVDWQEKKTSIFLNWKLLDSLTFSTGQTQPPYTIDGISMGVIANANYLGQYPVEAGIPGMMLDDVRIEAVPEPKTWVISSLGLLAICRRRTRRKAV